MKKIIYSLFIGILLSLTSNVYAQDSTDVFGCTDSSAINYNPFATVDDGSCYYENDTTVFNVYGCTDPDALNYNFLATIDDGSCIYLSDSTDVYGCTDPSALNYNPIATIDDGSCFYDSDSTGTDIYGCTDPAALNYNFLATIDDGSCYYENDSTVFDIYGCMDTAALNYDPMATIDDGSCSYYCDSTNASYLVTDIDLENGIITVVNTSSSPDLITDYLWDFGDGTTSSEEYPTHIYDSEGLYILCLTIITSTPSQNMFCTSTYCDTIGYFLFMPSFTGFTVNVIPESATGIEDVEESIKELKLYPNPANTTISLSYALDKSEVLTTTIYDLSGRVMNNWTANVSSGNHIENINISDLSPGVYHIELRNNNTRKLIRFHVIK